MLTLVSTQAHAQDAGASGRAAMLRYCSSCHDPAMVTSARRSTAEWDAVLTRMIGQGASIPDADLERIRAYLRAQLTTPGPQTNARSSAR